LVTYAEGAVEVDEIFRGISVLGGRLVDLHQVYFSLFSWHFAAHLDDVF
jgi:hypothetical protein